MCTHTVSFRPGFGSSLRTHTPGPHLPWAPSFRLCMKTGSPAASTVGVNEIIFEYAQWKSKLSSKNSLTVRKSRTSHTSIEFCKRKVNQLIDFRLRRWSFQTARFLECHFGQSSMFPRRQNFAMAFPNQSPQAGYLWIGTSVESRHETLYHAWSMIKTSIAP